MEKLKRGPKSNESERSSWSFVVAKITDRSGLLPSQLESIFKVGDGSGRVWRTWLNAKRLARNRDGIIETALELGWIPTGSAYLENYSPIKSFAIHNLNDPVINLLPTPEPPDKNLFASICANQILADAKDISKERQLELQRLSIPNKSPTSLADKLSAIMAKSKDLNEEQKKRVRDSLLKELQDENKQASLIVNKWRDGAVKLKAIRADRLSASLSVDEESDIDAILRIQLKAAYKKMGYR